MKKTISCLIAISLTLIIVSFLHAGWGDNLMSKGLDMASKKVDETIQKDKLKDNINSLISQKEYADALRQANNGLRKYPDDNKFIGLKKQIQTDGIKKQLDTAENYLKNNDFRNAKKYAQKAEIFDENSSKISSFKKKITETQIQQKLNTAQTYLDKNKFSEAKNAVRSALKDDSSSDEAIRLSEKIDQAEKNFKLSKIITDSKALFLAGKNREALWKIDEAIRIDATNSEAKSLKSNIEKQEATRQRNIQAKKEAERKQRTAERKLQEEKFKKQQADEELKKREIAELKKAEDKQREDDLRKQNIAAELKREQQKEELRKQNIAAEQKKNAEYAKKVAFWKKEYGDIVKPVQTLKDYLKLVYSFDPKAAKLVSKSERESLSKKIKYQRMNNPQAVELIQYSTFKFDQLNAKIIDMSKDSAVIQTSGHFIIDTPEGASPFPAPKHVSLVKEGWSWVLVNIM